MTKKGYVSIIVDSIDSLIYIYIYIYTYTKPVSLSLDLNLLGDDPLAIQGYQDVPSVL